MVMEQVDQSDVGRTVGRSSMRSVGRSVGRLDWTAVGRTEDN